MNELNTNKRIFWRNTITRTLLVVVTVGFIVWAMPREQGQRFRYDVGKPWMYGSFIAQFDFPIYKTDDALKEEQDSMLALFQPYYNFNEEVGRKQVKRFLHDFREGIPGLPYHFVPLIADRLTRLYQIGIMDTPDYNVVSQDSTAVIRVVNGNSAQGETIGCIYSTLSAYEQLFLDEQISPHRVTLSKCNLTDYIEPNLEYDKARSETEKSDLLSSIPPASGMVMAGQKIIDRGDIVNDYTYRVLNSFEREIKRRIASQNQITSTLLGQILYVGIMVIIFTAYLLLFRRDYFDKPRSIAMLYVLLTLFPVVLSLFMRHNFMSVYIIPFAMVPMFVRVFMDSRTAFTTHVIMVMICAAAVKYQYEFIIIQLTAGFVAIYSLRELLRRAQVFKTALLVAVSSVVVYLSLQMMQDNDFMKMDHEMNVHFAVNGVLLLLAYPLMYIIEKTFGFVSNVTLFELSNTNRGLLRDLSEVAPGTFQHSITVGNLAAEIANKIGAKSLLVRTGALYHDIGKMTYPVFFTENQTGINPHENMSLKESARIIISHVTEGVKMAEKANLPQIIKDFILTHHGAGVAKYFYINYQNQHPDEEVDPAPFSYPGPNPFTREQAILMIADGVEAASRSLNEYTEESISNLVNRIIDGDVESGYFSDCPINFHDLAVAKQVLIERLKSIYHTRIQYPELKSDVKPAQNNDVQTPLPAEVQPIPPNVEQPVSSKKL